METEKTCERSIYEDAKNAHHRYTIATLGNPILYAIESLARRDVIDEKWKLELQVIALEKERQKLHNQLSQVAQRLAVISPMADNLPPLPIRTPGD
jgi:hypothetical protein